MPPPLTRRALAATSPSERGPGRIDSLTGLRWWAAFVVFAYHLRGLAPLPPAAGAFIDYGYFGVTFFFVLSGFVLTWAWKPNLAVSTFYWRRIARIYPAHVVALALAIPVFTSFTPDPAEPWVLPVNIGALLLALVLLQGWSADPAVFFAGSPAAWSLTYEAFFYATHPLFSRFLVRLKARGALLFAAGTIVVAFSFRVATQTPATSGLAGVPTPIQHLSEFVLGMALAWAIRTGWRPHIPITLALGSVAAVIAGLVLAPRLAPGSLIAELIPRFATELVTVACGVVIVAFAARSVRGRRSIFAHPVMVRLGEWSFAFYLTHATLLYAVLAVAGPQPMGWRNLAWYVGLLIPALLIAALLHHLVEVPLERRMRGWKDRRDARRAGGSSRVTPVDSSPMSTERPYQMCVRTVMDTTDPEIWFDDEGVSSHALHYDRTMKRYVDAAMAGQRADELAAMVAKIKKAGEGKPYDCVIGISGGVDSSYLVLQAVKLGLRPLAVHFDSGWNSELAVSNIASIVDKLELDLVTDVADWREMKDLQLSFFKASVANCDIPTDHAFPAVAFREAARYGIRYILSGHNFATESILPKSWGYNATDARHLKAIQRRFGSVKLKSYPIMGIFKRYLWYGYIRPVTTVHLLNYLPYVKAEAKAEIASELGWRDYGGKHYESVFTRYFQGSYLPRKFGFDKRKAHLSSLIVSGQESRERAIDALAHPDYPSELERQDHEFIAKKLGLSVEQFDEVLAKPPIDHLDYPNSKWAFDLLIALTDRLGIRRRSST